MKTARQLNFILAAAMLVFVTCNNDGSVNRSGADTTVTGSTRETGEEDFVTDIADDNTRLILLLNAGVSKGTDQEVKSTAQKMLPDHKNLSNELREYAQKNNIVLPDPDTSNAVTIREKAGVEWDEEWADEVGDNQLHLLNRFEKAHRQIDDDTTLKKNIAKTLPILQSHYDASQKLESRLDKSN